MDLCTMSCRADGWNADRFEPTRKIAADWKALECCNYESSISSKNLGNSSVLEIITQFVEFRNVL